MKPSIQPEWLCWVGPARQGDLKAFERLYRLTRPKVHNTVYHLVGDADLAADLVQHAYIRAWERLHSLSEDRAFAGWLRQIAVNLTRDHWRSHHPTDDMPDDNAWNALLDPDPMPNEILETQQDAQQLRQSIAQLPLEFREVVVLHYLDDQPVQEVSQTLNIPKGTVLSRLSRARARLARMLNPLTESTL